MQTVEGVSGIQTRPQSPWHCGSNVCAAALTYFFSTFPIITWSGPNILMSSLVDLISRRVSLPGPPGAFTVTTASLSSVEYNLLSRGANDPGANMPS